MISLREMNDMEFEAFKAFLVEDYAADIARTYNVSSTEAHSNSEQQINTLLSQGRTTPRQFLWMVVNETAASIGHLWCDVDQAQARAFICDIVIYEPYRGKGYGKQTLLHLEAKLREWSIRRIGLHVFAYNTSAIALYQRLGYQTTGFDMQKDLPID